MPKYSVRFYSEYCQEYVVQATSKAEAEALAEEYDSIRHYPAKDLRRQELQAIVDAYERSYVGHNDTEINEVDADGNWLDELEDHWSTPNGCEENCPVCKKEVEAELKRREP